MMDFKVEALAFVTLAGILLLRQWKPEWAVFLRLAAAVLLFGLIASMMADVVADVRDIGGQTIPTETLAVLFKALGIALITQICASVCRDGGEAGLASWVEMAGKIEILLLSFPLIRNILAAAGELLNM